MATVVGRILEVENGSKVYCFFPGTERDIPTLEQYLPKSENVSLIPDPEKVFYKKFSVGSSSLLGFIRGSFKMLRMLPRSLKHLQGMKLAGDPFQLPGFVVVEQGSFFPYKAQHISDLPKINQLLCLHAAND